MKRLRPAAYVPLTKKQMQELAEVNKIPLEAVQAEAEWQAKNTKVFVNDIYQVAVEEFQQAGFDIIHLSIKRKDKRPVINWQHKQLIKNQLVGSECEAFELYPAERRLLNTANQYHLWCLKDPSIMLPFGFFDPRSVSVVRGEFFKQRPPEGFDDETEQPKKQGKQKRKAAAA